tara:strand:- start:101 stop:1030 length:930 start_codon:yes stop_codon:yes gene_type:complete
MLKVCHIRGEKDYWNGGTRWSKRIKQHYTALTAWEQIRGFNILDYKKKIRDVAVRSIIDSNEFDIICYNDEEFKRTLSEINDNDIIGIHSQDDDDIYLGGVLNDNLKRGIYNTPYTKFGWEFPYHDEETTINVSDLLHRNDKYSTDGLPRKTGSCNLIMVGEFFNFKTILNDMARNSFETMTRLNTFIFDWDGQGQKLLPIYNIPDIISIEVKGFFCMSYMQFLHKSRGRRLEQLAGRLSKIATFNEEQVPEYLKDSSNVELIDKTMCSLFLDEYSRVKNININNVKYWDDIKKVHEEFIEETQIPCNV